MDKKLKKATDGMPPWLNVAINTLDRPQTVKLKWAVFHARAKGTIFE